MKLDLKNLLRVYNLLKTENYKFNVSEIRINCSISSNKDVGDILLCLEELGLIKRELNFTIKII